MNRLLVMTLSCGVVLLVSACAAERASKSPPAAADAPPASAAGQASPAQQPQPFPSQQAPMPGMPGQPPDANHQPTTPVTPPQASGGPFATPPNRTVAMGQAANEIESSQRELDVAGGDCRNACRALGSMDRAAGRLCNLAQSPDETRKCSDAKTRVYSARDKVRNTCGTCPDTSVDKNAPVPSR